MATTYKIHVNDRNYSSWEIYDTDTLTKVSTIEINPIEAKLFSNDVFEINADGSIKLIHSTVRSVTSIPGVLMLDGNKTYGRQYKLEPGQSHTCGRAKSNGGKLLYKCIPDDKRLPAFLIPYEMKHVGFSKAFKNLYVTFTFDNWEDKHPRAKLDNVIGPVDVLDNFYEYQLYCKSLNASIQKFQKDTNKALADNPHEAIIANIRTKYPSIEDRTNQKLWHIITIDPPKSLDFDDGFSIRELDSGLLQLSVYISNVTIWMDSLNLWDSFSRRISTIYLPDKKRPMLPSILSDCLCSLQENVTRVAFVMDVFINKDSFEIENIQYSNCLIKVVKNYCYEEPKLLANPFYNTIIQITQELNKKNRYISHVRNSHEVVSYLMILMNYHCAKELIKSKSGIFRSTIMKREVTIPEYVPEEVNKHIKIWSSAAGQYINGSEIIDTRHELLDMDAYIHITSPIRRLVDLLNIIQFQRVSGIITLSEMSEKFYNKWLGDIEYINITMRSIRKIQCDSSLLDLCFNNPDILEKEYNGYLFDKICRNDGLYQFVIYLPEIKMTSRITMRDNFDNFECKKFKLYIFNDEEQFKRKIRLHLL
jgi:hypothetical protein